jgi:hypothetical protein
MPAEAARLGRRLSPRDRWFLGLLVALCLLGAAAAVAAGRFGGGAADAAPGGCVVVSRASWMGSATLRYCGAEARAYCREVRAGQYAAGHRASLEACRKAGLAVD